MGGWGGGGVMWCVICLNMKFCVSGLVCKIVFSKSSAKEKIPVSVVSYLCQAKIVALVL